MENDFSGSINYDVHYDADGNMILFNLGGYEVIIERNPDGSIAFWTDSLGNSGTDNLPVPDKKLLVLDAGTIAQQRPASLQWCLDPRLMPQGNVAEAECPDCDMPLSRCTCSQE